MRTFRSIRTRSWWTSALASVGGLALLAAGVLATPLRRDAQEPQKIELSAGRSQSLTAPWPLKGVSVTDPAVADVQLLTPELVLISGKTAGVTDVLIWGEAGATRTYRIEVAADLSGLQQALSSLFPDARLVARQSNNLTAVSGVLARAEQAAQLRAWLEGQGIKYVDLTRVAGVQQVQLMVRMAEVSRTAIRALGVNAFQGGDDFFWGSTIGPSGGGPINPVSIGPLDGASAQGNVPFNFTDKVRVSPAVTLFAGFPNSDLQVFVQALAENQYLRLLAEPNLVALSGEEASFLAGGEFPIPVVQGSNVGGAASVTIEYKPFGVSLKFRPIVLGDATIRLQIASEVSDLTDIGAVEIQGFRVPALVTRRADTTLEMRSGQTLAMAGLLNHAANAQSSRVPGLGDLPVLGALFRSLRYKSGETELLVLVSASLVEPISETGLPPLPGEAHVAPSDWELYALGRLEGGPPPRLSPNDSAWLQKSGLHRLKGPGPWATHEEGPVSSTARPGAPSASQAPASESVQDTQGSRTETDRPQR